MIIGGVQTCVAEAIDLIVGNGKPILINTLVMHRKPLRFDLLVSIGSINVLDGMINRSLIQTNDFEQ